MICAKCCQEVTDGPFCCQCGAKQEPQKKNTKSRGNGQGTIYKRGKSYIAVKTMGYFTDENGKRHRKTASKSFSRRRDAVNALPNIGITKISAKADRKAKTTFKDIYDTWLPTHRAGPNTLGNYKAAIKYFKPIWNELASDIDIDDLQECVDACPKGKATKRNMRTTCGLIYKYGIPRGYFPEKLNLADYLKVSGEDGVGGTGIPDEYLEKIKNSVGKIDTADYVYCQCYLGFRPSELLSLDVRNYDRAEKAFVGGAKTEAGKDRTVTVSPKIQPIIDCLVKNKATGPVFCAADGSKMPLKNYRAAFYALLESVGLDNPTYEVDGKQRHTYTPHSCRHTFATLMKRVNAASKDKLKLIGHTSEEMLRYYEDVSISDLRKITNEI
ncbi:tyrosine-type recombinase/integrase [Oscillibacter sp.]|uniref:tyrosine-type recombinase/integrase n=1 Tax=Oscillibacter sp. TaxID=1945593 RepID=UPI0028969583|nr:tyrosine-type recombinase/integrase [Oscillibacter sp.]